MGSGGHSAGSVPGESALRHVARAVSHRHGAAGIQRGEDNLAGRTWRYRHPGLGVHEFDETEIGIEVESAGTLMREGRALRPGHLGLGEGIDADDIHPQ